MALVISVLAAPGLEKPPEDFELTFDIPRVVIGRGEGCEVRLPDPTVTARHASIRQRGADYLLFDEGSSNGTFIDQVKLAPHSPRIIKSPQRFRVGGIWLEARVEVAMPPPNPSARAKQLALAFVTEKLRAEGEDARPKLRVISGPDAGKELAMDAGQRYVIGRGRDADFVLTDPLSSRRHVEVACAGDTVTVADLGSDVTALLADQPIEGKARAWKTGQQLHLGDTLVELRLEAVRELALIEKSPDAQLRAADIPVLADAVDAADLEVVEAPSEGIDEPVDESQPARYDENKKTLNRKPAKVGWRLADFAVLLVALGVLSLSVGCLVVWMRNWA